MRLSAFNRYVPGYPAAGQTLIHNGFSGGFVVVDAATRAALDRMDTGDPLDEQQRGLIDPGYLDEDVGVVVASREAEEQAFRGWYQGWRSARERLSVLISTTFACNLRCSYCFQPAGPPPTLSAELGAATAAWIAHRAAAIGASSIRLQLTGGEPLLHPERVEQIVAGVRALAPACEVTFGLITNGVLLDRRLVQSWVGLGLTGIQVTLDGDQRTHSLTRRGPGGADTFARSFAGAVGVSDLVQVSVRGNYRPDTAHGFPPLVEQLRRAGLPAGSRVQFLPALAGMGAPPESAQACTWEGSSPEIRIALADVVLRAGFDPGPLGSLGPCGLHQHHSLAIDPRGHIYKCAGFLGHPEWAVGDVATGLSPRYDEMCAIDPLAACGDCAHRPACGGGCLASAWLATGRPAGVSCEAGYFDRHGDDICTRDYAVAAAEGGDELLALLPPSLELLHSNHLTDGGDSCAL